MLDENIASLHLHFIDKTKQPSKEDTMILVSGSTGFLGSEICRQLLERGKPVRALVRTSSDKEKVDRLKQLGAEIVTGDLKGRASLDVACKGCSAVISTVTSIITRKEGDTFDAVDKNGNINLAHAAKASGVDHIVFISFPPTEISSPLSEAKLAAEKAIHSSGIAYTILQPVNFMEVWLSPAVGFDVQSGNVQFAGDGTAKTNWISLRDVATFAVLSLDNESARNRVIQLGGPEALSYSEIAEIFENSTGKKLSVTKISEQALRGQFESAEDEVQKTFSALMLTTGAGWEVDMSKTLQEFPVKMSSVRDFARQGMG